MTVTISNKYQTIYGDRRVVMADVAFDSSYAFGGESINTGLLDGFKTVQRVNISSKGPFQFEYDYTNKKVKVFAPAPPIVHEELVTVTSNVGYLRYPAAHINYIVGAAANYIPIAGGLTPATGQCSVDQGFNDTTGVLTKGSRTSLTFLGADSVSTVYVSYATQAWVELTDNMSMAKMLSGAEVYGDGLTFHEGTPDSIRLGTDIVAMQSITWSDAGTIKVPEVLKDGGIPAATLEMEIDFVKTTTFGEVNTFATDAVDTTGDIMWFVYTKMPSSGFIKERFTNAEIVVATNTIVFTANPLIYGTCGQLPMETSNKQAIWIKGSDTLAAREIQWTHLPHFVNDGTATAPTATMEAATNDDAFPAWIAGDPNEIQVQPLEVTEGTDLSSKLATVKVEVIGY